MKCKLCNGTGKVQWEDEVDTCPNCNGIGHDPVELSDLLEDPELDEEDLFILENYHIKREIND